MVAVTGAVLTARGTTEVGVLPLLTPLTMAAFLPMSEIAHNRYRLWRSDDVERWLHTHLALALSNAADDHVRAAINAGLELRRLQARLDNTKRTDLHTLVGISNTGVR